MANIALVVDDDIASGEILTYMLGQLNFKVKWVTTAEDAIVELAQITPALMLLDIKLPGRDGTAVIDWLLEHGQIDCFRLIIITAGGVADRLAKYDRKFALLTKPIRHRDLQNYIQT